MWEAILEPSVAELGEIVWIVDMNRQSLDRVVPNIAAGRLASMFSAAGWQVIDRQVRPALGSPLQTGGRRRDCAGASWTCPTPNTNDCCDAAQTSCEHGCPATAPEPMKSPASSPNSTITGSPPRSRNLGGHDLDALREAYAQIDDTRPTVIIAYTIKGYGLPIQGHPQNHSSLLTEEQFSELAASLGKDATRPWSRFDADSAAGRICRDARERLRRSEIPHARRRPRCPRRSAAHRRPSRPRRRRWAGRCWT